MSLADYKPETLPVQLGREQSMEVQGLSLEHLAVLLREHMPDLDAVFDLFDGVENMPQGAGQQLAMTLISQAPGLVANVIALAANQPEHAEKAAMLPAPVQIDALMKIGELTFTEVGGVKKFLEHIAALLKTVNPQTKAKVTKALRKKAG